MRLIELLQDVFHVLVGNGEVVALWNHFLFFLLLLVFIDLVLLSALLDTVVES